jgi:hypothetical protein
MAVPVVYQTMNNVGVDPTLYYTNLATAGASVTPEYPSVPFLPGTKAIGSDGSEFLFVQASTSIALTDFVVITASAYQTGTTGAYSGYQANSITNTNVNATNSLVGIGSAGLVLKQSVTLIPAGAFFWACMKGQYIPATTSGGTTQGGFATTGGTITAGGGVVLFTTATAGILSSIPARSSLACAIAGIICVNSLTVSIPASVVPPQGTLTSGVTVGPVVNLNNPRIASATYYQATTVTTSLVNQVTSLSMFGF